MRQTLRLDAPDGARHVELALARNRGSYRIDSVLPIPESWRASPHALSLRWKEPPAQVRVGLTVWGEPVRAALAEGNPPPAGPAPAADATHVFEWRRRRAEVLGGPIRARAFFNELEERTLAWDKSRANLQMLLQMFFTARLRGDDAPALDFAPGADVAHMIGDVCALLVALFDRHFTSMSDVEEAFDLFANGELSLMDPDSLADAEQHGVARPDVERACQPNSLMFYLFAELAALGRQLGVVSAGKTFSSPAVWNALLPGLVYAHRGFARTYAGAARFRWAQEIRGVPAAGRSAPMRAERQKALASLRGAALDETWGAELRAQVERH